MATVSAAQALVGRVIADGRYEIQALLGEGGMGAVYKARQVQMDRLVALKLIRTEVVHSKDAAARFYKEMKVTAKVEHPNSIRVYDYGETDGQLYLAMEFLAGKSLKTLLGGDNGGIVPLERIVRIGKQVANALGAAHEAGVVHRDLKPDNVMVLDSYGERDFVKVLDFGIAKSLDETTQLTAVGSPIGTPAYMAPEQALGRPVDARTDLYSLGVILYQMACGRVPFDAPTLASMLVAQATAPPPPVTQIAPATSPALAALIMSLLEKEPAVRPQTAAEVVARLDACLHPGRVSGAPAAARSGRGKWIIAGVVAVALVGGGAAFVATRPPSAPAAAAPIRLDAGKPLAVATPDAGKPFAAAPASAPTGPRADLDAVIAKLGLPPLPEACRATDAQMVARLLTAARLIDQGTATADEALATIGDKDSMTTEEAVLHAYAVRDNGKESLAWAQEALGRCSSYAGANGLAGNAQQKLGRYDAAEVAYLRALASAPGYGEARFNLGTLQLRKKDPAAIDTFGDLLRRHPDYPGVRVQRALAFIQQNRDAEAITDLEEVVRTDPKNGEAWGMLGEEREQVQKGDWNAAYCQAKALGDKTVADRCQP